MLNFVSKTRNCVSKTGILHLKNDEFCRPPFTLEVAGGRCVMPVGVHKEQSDDQRAANRQKGPISWPHLASAKTDDNISIAPKPPPSSVVTSTWAGVLDFPHAANQTLNITVADAGSFSTATFQWTWDETSPGITCHPNTETLVWTEDASSEAVLANGSACGSASSFYSFEGTLSKDGKTVAGSLMSGGGRHHLPGGTWRATKGAPQVPPTNACAPRKLCTDGDHKGCAAPPFPRVWPRPLRVSRGTSTIKLAEAFTFAQLQSTASAAAAAPPTPALAAAFARFHEICFGEHAAAPTAASPTRLLGGLDVIVKSSRSSVFFGMDESYTLTIDLSSPSTTAGAYRARLVAETLAGAYHGLESFSQLLAFDSDMEAYLIGGVPSGNL